MGGHALFDSANSTAVNTTFRIGWIVLCLALAFAARCWNVRDVFLDQKIHFVDADCYSRMTRARLVAEHPGAILRHHDFENWPQGTTPHTTAPLDYLIVGLKRVFDAAFALSGSGNASVLRGQTLDLAGALIGPLLGAAGALVLAFVLWKIRARFWEAALLFYAASPILVHGTLLGRPDHQALLLFLLTLALGAELALVFLPAETPRRGWAITGGVAWALSLWVSFFEPLILLIAVVALWLVWNRRALWTRERRVGWAIFAALLFLSIAVEGWRVSWPDAATRQAFALWQRTIGEMASLDLRSPLLHAWLGWGALFSPMLLGLAARQDRRVLGLLGLLAATFALALWQVRWGYFLALVFAWTLPWQLQVLRRAWLAGLVVAISAWPMLRDWDRRLYPGSLGAEQATMQRAETVALRELVTTALAVNGGPFLAPWWLSPSIAYWTGQPGVAGSSHQSLPGIMDTARFYLSTDDATAAAILRARRVRWVLADEPSREIGNSATLLGIPPPAGALATTLAERPDEAPEFLREWKVPSAGGLRYYRLYVVDDATLPR